MNGQNLKNIALLGLFVFLLVFYATFLSSGRFWVQSKWRQAWEYVGSEGNKTTSDDCSHAKSQIFVLNNEIRRCLKPLLHSLYFRYVKIDLSRPCPFWKNEPLCMENDCDVTRSNHIPSSWKNISLGSIKFPTFKKERAIINTWDDDSVDFSLVESESASDGVYVNLLENPERYTGYAGHSAHQIWQAIYAENCFDYRSADHTTMERNPDKESEAQEKESSVLPSDALFQEPKGVCPERTVFYKLISGLHASISMHIAYKYLNQTSGTFSPNLQVYQDRVGMHPNRLDSLHFTYVVLLRAFQKMSSYLAKYPYETGDVYENQKARDMIQRASVFTISCPNLFNERSLFQGEASLALKREFRHHFKNISRIMDCVGCQKCRLWGKTQTIGMGTALKVLFSFGDREKTLPETFNYRLTKTEIVAFMNTLGKFSDSILFHHLFQKMIAEETDSVFTFGWIASWRLYLRFLTIFTLTLVFLLWRRRCNSTPRK